jgi:microsomal dipeptidase-like Zn-dependent dipeptidase
LQGIVRAIQYAVNIAGIDHVGLGSDFDGHVSTPFDTTGLPMLTESLLAAGLSEEDVAKVLGGNVRRVLAANLSE